jgi:hypothetical protein
MVTQVREPAALDLKPLSDIVLPVPRVTQRLRVDNTAPVYRSMAEKDSTEVGAYLQPLQVWGIPNKESLSGNTAHGRLIPSTSSFREAAC